MFQVLFSSPEQVIVPTVLCSYAHYYTHPTEQAGCSPIGLTSLGLNGLNFYPINKPSSGTLNQPISEAGQTIKH